MSDQPVYLAAGMRTPFVNVDSAFADGDAVALSVSVAIAATAMPKGSHATVSVRADGGLGSVALLQR